MASSSTPKRLPDTDDIELASVVLSDGHATCPRCTRKVNCGAGGTKNLIQHWRSKQCKKAAGTKSSTPAISSFFIPTPRPTYVPQRVRTPPPIQADSQLRPLVVPTRTNLTSPGQPILPTSPPTPQPDETNNMVPHSPGKQHALELLRLLDIDIQWIPTTVPEAVPGDALYKFTQEELAVNSPDEAWEVLDPALNRLFGFGITAEAAALHIRRGEAGMAAVHHTIAHFVMEYEGVTGDLLEGKIELIRKAIKHASDGSHDLPSPPGPHQETALPRSTDRALLEADTNKLAVVKHLPHHYTPAVAHRGARHATDQPIDGCIGFELTSPSCPTGVSRYPFMLHETETLPWDVEVRRGLCYARAHDCLGYAEGSVMCIKCAGLQRIPCFASIRARLETGVSEYAPMRYHGMGGLMELSRRKNLIIDELRLGQLNRARHVNRLEGVVNAHKELVVAISQGKVARVDRILQMCLRRGARVDTMIGMVYRAQAGTYHPKSYTEEDELQGFLLWRLGGARIAGIAHRIFGTPAISTLRQRASVAKFVPSPAAPKASEVVANLNAGFEPIKDLLCLLDGEVWHAVAMYDELHTEKRPRWCPRTNMVLGLCRECQNRYGTQLCSREDLEMLFEELERGEIHLACEATVGAIGLLTGDSRLYSARPILLSGSCKNENAEAHAEMLKTSLDAVNSRKAMTNVRIVSIASDGEARRGKALVQLTFKAPLSPSSPIYPLLAPLHLLDLHVGDDDITADKDYKHVAFKRIRNTLLREKGVLVLGVYLTPPVLRKQLRDAGHASVHIESVLNASDKQDVELAYLLEHDIATIPPAPSSSSAIYTEVRDAMRVFGSLCHHLTFPYICVDLSLGEQLVHASTAAHMLMALFRHGDARGAFLPTPLLIDLMIMIKNFFFCVAKAKVDKPKSKYYLILNGTDRVETLFGILRTMVGNDSNVDILQLAIRIAGTTEVANILAKHPEWDQSPRRLHLPVVTRDGKPVGGADHVTPRLWRGNVFVEEVNLATCWKRGRRDVEAAYPRLGEVLRAIDKTDGASMLAPFGPLLMHTPTLTEDDHEVPDVDVPLPPSRPGETGRDEDSTQGLRELEDAAAELDDATAGAPNSGAPFSKTIEVDGVQMNKARALAQRFKYKTVASSTDRLRRVAQQARFDTRTANALQSELFFDAGPLIAISHPIATLIACEGHFFLALGEVTALKLHSKAIEHVPTSILREQSVELTYQLISLRSASALDDPTLKHDWRSGQLLPYLQTIPGALAQAIDPELATNVQGRPYYLFSSESLIALALTLQNEIIATHASHIPRVQPKPEYPYREPRGMACFATGPQQDVGVHAIDSCRYCKYPFDFSKMPRVLAHIGSHILYDLRNIARDLEPCGLCLRSYTLCQIYVYKTKGRRSNYKIDTQRSTCNMPLNFKPGSAAKCTASSACSNSPLICSLCPTGAPAVWRYNYRAHMIRLHPSVPLASCEEIWTLTAYEKDELQDLWSKRHKHPKPRRKPDERIALVLSEAHTSQMALRTHSVQGDDVNGDQTAVAAGLVVVEAAEDAEGIDEEPSDDDEDASSSSFSWEAGHDDDRDDIADAESIDDGEALMDTLEDMFTGDGVVVADEHDKHQNLEEEQHDAEVEHAPLEDTTPPAPIPQEPAKTRETRASRKRKAIDRPPCGCGELATENGERDVIECAGRGGDGCATRWYHLECVGPPDGSIPARWRCDSCKRQRRA